MAEFGTPVFDTDTWTADVVHGDVTITATVAGDGNEDEADVLAEMNAATEAEFKNCPDRAPTNKFFQVGKGPGAKGTTKTLR